MAMAAEAHHSFQNVTFKKNSSFLRKEFFEAL